MAYDLNFKGSVEFLQVCIICDRIKKQTEVYSDLKESDFTNETFQDSLFLSIEVILVWVSYQN